MAEWVKAEDWYVRAAAWELLALSFRYPETGLVEAVASGEWAEAGREIAGALGAGLPGGWGEGLLPAGAPDGAGPVGDGALRAEATRLFVGAPEPAASPYEGVWRAGDDGVQALLFVNPHSMAVERFCKACGLGRPEGTNEPLDHVATECELLEHLALRAVDEAAAADAFAGGEVPASLADSAGLPGGSAAAAYGAFLDEHVRAWAPRFAAAVEAESRHPFYRAAAQLLGAVIDAA